MSSRNIRTLQLLEQIKGNPFAKTLAPGFDISSDFERDMLAVGANEGLSQKGRRDAANGHLRRALRDVRDFVQKPIDQHRAKTEEMRATIKRPAYDKTDIVAAMARRELRDASRTMTSGQRAGHMAGPKRSLAFVDAVLEFADDPWMAGVDVFNPTET
jgi:hypothetical protein